MLKYIGFFFLFLAPALAFAQPRTSPGQLMQGAPPNRGAGTKALPPPPISNVPAPAFLANPTAENEKLPGWAMLLDGVVAVVGDKVVLKSDVDGQLLQARKASNAPLPDSAACVVIDQILTQKLLLSLAERDSLKVTSEEVEGQLERRVRYFINMVGSEDKLVEFYGKTVLQIKDEFRPSIREQLLAQKEQEKITGGVLVSPAEVKSYFEHLPKDSLPTFPAEFEVGVLVRKPLVTDAAKAYALEKLQGIRERIVKGEKFSTLALLYSEDPGSAAKGGELGFFGRGDMVGEFEATAFKLKPGEVSAIIKTKFGYHVLQLVERRGERINVRHILIKPPVGKNELANASMKLDSIRQDIMNGKYTFEDAVKKFSQDEDTRGNGGMMQNARTGDNRFTAEQMDPQVYFQIDKLKEGELTESVPYAEPDGSAAFKMYYLKAQTKPHQANLKEDYSRIMQAALDDKKAQALEKWFLTNSKNTFVRVDAAYAHCSNLAKWIAAGSAQVGK